MILYSRLLLVKKFRYIDILIIYRCCMLCVVLLIVNVFVNCCKFKHSYFIFNKEKNYNFFLLDLQRVVNEFNRRIHYSIECFLQFQRVVSDCRDTNLLKIWTLINSSCKCHNRQNLCYSFLLGITVWSVQSWYIRKYCSIQPLYE